MAHPNTSLVNSAIWKTGELGASKTYMLKADSAYIILDGMDIGRMVSKGALKYKGRRVALSRPADMVTATCR